MTIDTYVGIVQQDGHIHLTEPASLPEGRLVYVIVPAALDVHAARRRANRWLMDHVGDMIMADQPTFVKIDEQAIWRFGAFVTALRKRPQGPIGYVDVDASTGQVLTDDADAQEMIARGRQVELDVLPTRG